MPTKEPASWIPWIIIGIMGAMLYQQHKPVPEPAAQSIEQIVSKTHAETAKNYATVFRAAADKVAAGEIKDEEALYNFLKKDLDDARIDASSGLDKLLDSNIPTVIDDATRGSVSSFLRRVGGAW
ncbi:MAG: hypothetical protein EBR82_53825 [Caulobacteraceae bacterium]|nr:hypothetical protein [Caulobacteraceae bacterium]